MSASEAWSNSSSPVQSHYLNMESVDMGDTEAHAHNEQYDNLSANSPSMFVPSQDEFNFVSTSSTTTSPSTRATGQAGVNN